MNGSRAGAQSNCHLYCIWLNLAMQRVHDFIGIRIVVTPVKGASEGGREGGRERERYCMGAGGLLGLQALPWGLQGPFRACRKR